MTDEQRQARLNDLCGGIELSDRECLAELKILIGDKENEVILEPRFEDSKRELYALKRVTDMLERSIEKSKGMVSQNER